MLVFKHSAVFYFIKSMILKNTLDNFKMTASNVKYLLAFNLFIKDEATLSDQSLIP